MNKVEAQSFLRLREVHNELCAYADYREKIIKDNLVTAAIEDIRGLQQSFAEIRRLRTLSDEMGKALKED